MIPPNLADHAPGPSGYRWRLIAGATAAVICLGLLLIWSDATYRRQQQTALRTNTRSDAAAYVAGVSSALRGAQTALDSAVALARHCSSAQESAEPVGAFAEDLRKATPAIRSLSIVGADGAPAVWPPRRAADACTVCRTDPEAPTRLTLPPLPGGGREVVLQRAVFRGGRFSGTATLHLDAAVLFRGAGLSNPTDDNEVALRDSAGHVLVGSPKVFNRDPVVGHVALPGVSWEIGVVPRLGWEGAGRVELMRLRVSSAIAALLLIALGVVGFAQRASMKAAIAWKTRELQEANADLRRENSEREDAERALRESDEFRSGILATVPTGVIVVDAESRKVVEVNDAALRIVGTHRGEAVGFACGQRVCGSPTCQCQVGDLGASIKNYETSVVRPDGTEVPVLRTAVLATVGGRRYVIESVTDLTEQKRIQRELQASQERYRTLLEASPDVVYQLDRQERYLYANANMAKAFGCQPDQVRGHRQSEFFPPERAALNSRYVQSVFATGRALFDESSFIRGGEREWCDTRLVPVRDASGNIASVLGITRDITARKEAEEATRRLVAILEATPDFVGIADVWGRTTYLNPAAKAMMGMDEDADPMGEPIESFSPEWAVQRLRGEALPQAFDCGVWVGESAVLTVDGREVPTAQVVLAHRRENGEVTHLSTMMRDLTDAKRAEEELRSMNRLLEERVSERTATVEQLLTQKDSLLNQLGHDLKTPLTPLLGLLPLVLRTQTSAKTREMLEICVRNAEYMSDLVRKTLDICQLDSPAAWMEAVTVSLAGAVQQALDDGAYGIKHPGIQLVNEVAPDLYVRADPLRLREVLFNLLDNACRHTPARGVLRVGASRAGDFVTVAVADTGEGVPAGSLSRVFDEFYKVDSSRHDRKTSGLGLSICRRIVERHGGTIWAESPGEGLGTTICFTLPEATGGANDVHTGAPDGLSEEEERDAPRYGSG